MLTDNTRSTITASAVRRAYIQKSEAEPQGWFVSRKNGRGIPTWYDRDRRFCEMAERCSRIVAFEERPDMLILDDRGHPMPFVIDFLVELDTRLVLIGLPLGFMIPEATEARYVGLAQTQCAMNGKEFVHLPGAMPTGMVPVRDDLDASLPVMVQGISYQPEGLVPLIATKRTFPVDAYRLFVQSPLRAGGAHDVACVGDPA